MCRAACASAPRNGSICWRKRKKIAPGVFVGITTAGHEEQEKLDGGPFEMKEAYARARAGWALAWRGITAKASALSI